MFKEVLTVGCDSLKMPKNKSETMIVASYVPYGATADAPNVFSVTAASHIVQEGVTPDADTITRRDVTFILDQYMALMGFTDKQMEIHEDGKIIGPAMKKNVGERMGLVKELAIFGGMKACTNVFYSGGTTRGTVDEKLTEKVLQRTVRSLKAEHAKIFRPAIAPSVNFNTSPVEASYVAFCHTDCEADIRDLPGFVPTTEYGGKQLISECEFGAYQNLRFLTSPELSAYADSGAAIAALGLKSTTGANADVYPIIVMGEEAFAQVQLRDKSDIEPIYVGLEPSKSDPGGQRGYLGAKFWHTNGITNNGWMAIIEVAVDDLL
jgi:N4-gp56 family major capsid protein